MARWLSVVPARARYAPEVGDIIVGRVREVAAKRWLVDIGARGEASLPLAAMHLAGGAQRRRTTEDALAMRGLLGEGDLLCAEVHSLPADGGGVTLHARSLQFGRLSNGILLRAPPALLPRQKAHVVALPPPLAVDVVLGVNGWIWLTGSLGLGGGGEAAAAATAGSSGGFSSAAARDALAIEDELAEAIEARKRAAAEAPATPAQRRAVAALRSTVFFCCDRGLPITVEALTAGAIALLRAAGDGVSAADAADTLMSALCMPVR